MDGTKRRRRGVPLAAAGLAAVFALVGCGGSGGDDSAVTDSGGRPAVDAEAGAERAGAEPAGAGPAGAEKPGAAAADLRVDQRSIVYTGSMRVQVRDVDQAAREAVTLATAAGGFVGGDERRTAGGDATAELTLRVPAAKFSVVVEDLAGLGTQQRREISTEDVTEETVDLDARITTQRARVDNARRLLSRATSIGDLVSLENELARREADLASLEAKKRRLADLTALSTITVSLVGPDARPLEDETEAGFVAGLKGGWKVFLTSMTVLLTVLGALLPWLVAFGVPLGVLWWFLRRRRQRRPTVGLPPLPAQVPGAAAGAAPSVPGARSAP
ncbi:DUF4349 domain-containing protein [Micromonospora endolithica]|uniref:DUF4349 domain-containing protein n=1 Tax=Micromonospora endolithica TaxID=230091 RepID=A0A3A9Z6I2_9ACTN|nr:DUF4349 domain-containing protein [Micromonospora endolithica]RKN43474.1 DUF4349 domain-containing protein [Micromonospora endolithica]TWJ24055.1 uncharacterized protein DUF4349 [Micromonospora endolithica]